MHIILNCCKILNAYQWSWLKYKKRGNLFLDCCTCLSQVLR